MNNDKILTMLGFAKKANQLVAGDSNVKDSLFKKNNLCLIILSEDSSENRKNYWQTIANNNQIPFRIALNKAEIGNAIGMSPRGIIGIKNREMAKQIELLL